MSADAGGYGEASARARVPQAGGFARWPYERPAKQAGKALRERLQRSAFGRPGERTWQRRGDGTRARRAAGGAVRWRGSRDRPG